MKTFRLIASQAFASEGRGFGPGDTIAVIQSDLDPGAVASLIAGAWLVDAICEDDGAIPEVNPEVEGQTGGDGQTGGGTDTQESVYLSAILTDQDAENLAAESLLTLSDLQAWLEAGGNLVDITGIGKVAAKRILTATGLS